MATPASAACPGVPARTRGRIINNTRTGRSAQRWVVAGVLRSDGPYELPLAVRLGLKVPVLRDLPTRLIALGARQVRPKTR